MSLLEIFILGVALAMDAIAVSMANCMVYRNLRLRDYALMPLLFGGFQAGMPLIGYFAGGIFADIITKYSGIVIFVILGIVGGKMILECFVHKDEDNARNKTFSAGIILMQAIATSIDAFAVGIGFVAAQVDIAVAVLIIGVVTGALVVVAILIGRKFGDIFGDKAGILGGVVLIIIGIKALI